jgi:DNA-binding response OmpR family regulator
MVCNVASHRRWRREADPSGAVIAPQAGVLVVDDEPSIRSLLAVALRQQGFCVWLAADGREAIELDRRHGPEIALVLLDVRMPGLDGPETLTVLRKINPTVMCCFMSDNAGEMKLPAPVIAKPFRLTEVKRLAQASIS